MELAAKSKTETLAGHVWHPQIFLRLLDKYMCPVCMCPSSRHTVYIQYFLLKQEARSPRDRSRTSGGCSAYSSLLRRPQWSLELELRIVCVCVFCDDFSLLIAEHQCSSISGVVLLETSQKNIVLFPFCQLIICPSQRLFRLKWWMFFFFFLIK